MKKTLAQTLVLGGFYFVISSLFEVFSENIGTFFSLIFPLFLFIVIIFAFLKPIQNIVIFNDKHPNISLLLSVIGAYTYVYFSIRLYGFILEKFSDNTSGYTSSLLQSYNYWYDVVDAILSFAFVAGIVVSCFVILYKSFKSKK